MHFLFAKNRPLIKTISIIVLILSYNASIFSLPELPENIDDPTDCDIQITVPSDITICSDGEVFLGGEINGLYDDYVWCEDGIETPYDLNEFVDVDKATTFTLKANYLSFDNIIVNGDFEGGDGGFTTDYFQGQGNCNHGAGYLGCEGAYNVISDPSDGHTNFDPCSDNGGGGNMMVVNGAGSLQQVWCQEVCVDPDGSYIFNAYGTSVNSSSPASLQFSIDGSLIGDVFGLSGSTCGWEFFEAEWQADGETSVEICVTNQNTATGGNDFALDDIGFFRICEEEMSFDVTISDFLIDYNSPEDIDCNTFETLVELDISPDAGYTIIWDTNDGNIINVIDDGYTLIADQAGEYFVTVTDDNGCEKEEIIEIYSDIEPLDINVIIEDILTCDVQSTEVYVDSDNNDLIFTWYDENDNILSFDETIDLSMAGSYYVISEDEDTGCDKRVDFEVIENITPPEFLLSKSSDLDCNTTSVTISLDTISNNVIWEVPVNYPPSIPIPTDSEISAFEPGIYIATIESDNGCTHTDSIEILESIPLFDYSIQADSIINCNIPRASIDIQYDTTNFNIDWLTLADTYNDSISFSLSTAGVYLFTLQDTIGCELTDSIIIASDMAPPTPINVQADLISCTEPTSTVTADNPNNYDITWTQLNGTGGVGDSYQVSETGILSYTYTAANGCTAHDSLTIEASDDIPILNISGDTLTCEITNVELTLTSDKPIVNYTWSNTTETNLSNQNNITVTDADTYSIEVITDLGCVATAEFVVEIDTISPLLMLPADNIIDCSTSIISEDVIIDDNYRSVLYTGDWYDELDNNITITDEGTYTLSVIGNNGCISEDSITVITDTIPILVDIITDTILDCNIDTLIASFTTNDTYTSIRWDSHNGTSRDSILSITSPGTYTLTAIGDNGCISSDMIEIIQDVLPPTFMASASEINCAFPQSTISVNASHPTESIIYQDSNGIVIGSGNNFMTDIAETITIEVTGTNGCISSAEITAQVDLDNFDFEVTADTITCNMTEVMVAISDSLDYFESNIYDINGNRIGDLSDPVSEAGMYVIELILENGCTSTDDLMIEEDYTTVDFSVSDIELSCANSSAPLRLNILSNYDKVEILNASNEIIGDENTSLSESGTYEVIVYNVNGCTNTKSFDVIELLDVPQLENYSIDYLDCGESIALQISNIQGGLAPYTITIDNNLIAELNEINTLAAAGQYSIQIEDDNGCSSDTILTVPELIPLMVEPISDIMINAGENPQLNLNVNRPLNEIQEIQWRDEVFLSCYDCLNPIFSGDTTTSYQVNVLDIYGCTTETEIRIILERVINYYIPNVIHLSNNNPAERNFTLFSDGDDIALIESLSIYDRWGNKVFENENFLANDPSLGWNGNFNEVSVEQGVYVYYAVLITAEGEKISLAGDLTVLR